MRAAAGDWELRDESGMSWSVSDEIFRNTYRRLSEDLWERTGTVIARSARRGELVTTLEGDAVAGQGDWVVQGEAGERWPVPGDVFSQRYQVIDDAVVDQDD